MHKSFFAIIFIVIFLLGCASQRLIDNQVNAFAPHPIPPGSSYRFERLPSQQADAVAQSRLEAMAEHALARVGMKRDDAAAHYTVQVSATLRAQSINTDRPALGWMLGNGGISVGSSMRIAGLAGQTNYWHEVGLVLRHQTSQNVVFESRATHDGPWSDIAAILPAMLQAALQDFPNPPTGVRRVNIDIPR